MSTSVFISGASGYIAQHIVQELTNNGYIVVGTVRSASKGEFLKSKFGSKFSYEIVEDIQVSGAFDEALKAHPEITVILHTASPFTLNVKGPEDLIVPAVQGTKTILESTKKYAPQVERFVVTSSFAAILSPSKHRDPTATYTEASWNDITPEIANSGLEAAYLGAKTFAERAAWDFVETEKPNFVLSTVNPGYVFGPQAFDDQVASTLNTSSEIVNLLLHSKLGQEDYIKADLCWIDVRDVARAHLAAFEKEETKNQRLLVGESRFTEQTILDTMNENPALKGKIAVGVPGSDVEAAALGPKIDNTKTRELLGFKFIDFKTTINETVEQILAFEDKQ